MQQPRFLTLEAGAAVMLPAAGGLQRTVHVFERTSIDAINAALAAERPLLVRGEPGTGKSQMARAAAVALGRNFVAKVIDARTESRDLFYALDAVARLARAQLLGATAKLSLDALNAELSETNFLRPGPLWWGYDWESASAQAAKTAAGTQATSGGNPSAGCVVLLDEIDKADSSVPNGLLEALGNGEFYVPGHGLIGRRPPPARAPLVIVTTNEERVLPDAFLRRCLVLQLALPGLPKSAADTALVDWLVARGKAHFPHYDDVLLRSAAEQLVDDRARVLRRDLVAPGQAEYLDLLRAVDQLSVALDRPPATLLDELKQFVLRKHPEAPHEDLA